MGLDTWTGAFDEVDVFVLYYGKSKITRWLTDEETGEKCYYKTFCRKLGVGIMVFDPSGHANAIFNGQKCGKNLEGTSAGIGLDVGPVALSIATDSNSILSLSGGGGVSWHEGNGINAFVCNTTITK